MQNSPFNKSWIMHFGQHVPWIQGVYYLITGLWPLLDMDSFQAVSGPKTDIWLVKTIALLLAVNGFFLMVAGLRRRISNEMMLLGMGIALSLIGIEMFYVANQTISRVYLLDTIIEVLFISAWIRRLFLYRFTPKTNSKEANHE